MRPASKRTSHCNKTGFTTLLGAQIALKKLVSRKRKGDDPIATQMSVYKCLYCPNFYIGRDRVKGIDWSAVEAHDKKIKARTAAIREGQQ